MARKIFVIANTHFNHANIIKYCNRPFNSVEEMNETMINNWNNIVSDQDIVYHLGDVFIGGNPELLYNLKGRKRLVVGNHDALKNPVIHKVFQKIMMWRIFPEYGVVLTHVPIHESSVLSKYNKKQLINVHGHIHDKSSPKGPYRCVCVEQINYTPVDITTIK
jgi:calcineurin-like phosphoesterase family protein